MGFFQSLGNSISKVAKGISLNNAIKVVSGNGGAVAKDLIDRGTSGFKPSKATPKPTQKTTLQTNIENALVKTSQQGSDKLFDNLTTKVANDLKNSSNLDTLNNGLAKFGSAVWFKANWQKYKIAIIAFIVFVVGVSSYFIFRKKPTQKGWRK